MIKINFGFTTKKISPTLHITMQEIQFVNQINMLQQKGFNSNHHSLPKQLQLLTVYRLLQRRVPRHNLCGTKNTLNKTK